MAVNLTDPLKALLATLQEAEKLDPSALTFDLGVAEQLRDALDNLIEEKQLEQKAQQPTAKT